MRYLIIILLFPFALYGQTTKIVNGVTVPLTQAEIQAIQKEWATQDSIAKDSTVTQRDRIEKRIQARQVKLLKFYIVAGAKLSKANFDNFVQSTRNERSDYPYNPDLLITWINVTFPAKAYFDADLQAKLLNILQ